MHMYFRNDIPDPTPGPLPVLTYRELGDYRKDLEDLITSTSTQDAATPAPYYRGAGTKAQREAREHACYRGGYIAGLIEAHKRLLSASPKASKGGLNRLLTRTLGKCLPESVAFEGVEALASLLRGDGGASLAKVVAALYPQEWESWLESDNEASEFAGWARDVHGALIRWMESYRVKHGYSPAYWELNEIVIDVEGLKELPYDSNPFLPGMSPLIVEKAS